MRQLVVRLAGARVFTGHRRIRSPVAAGGAGPVAAALYRYIVLADGAEVLFVAG
jgi:hypothetical protein